MQTAAVAPDFLPFFRAGSTAAVGEALYALTFEHDGEGEPAPRSGARPWSDVEVEALLGALGQTGPAHGHSLPVGDAIIDTVRMTTGPRNLYFVVWQGEHPVRSLFSEDPAQSHRWQAIDGGLLKPWLAERRAEASEASAPGRTHPTTTGTARGAHPLNAIIAGTRGIVDLTSGAISAVGHLRHEPYWQAETTVVVMMALGLSLHKRFQVGPFWLVPAIEGLLLVALFLHDPRHPKRARRLPRERLLTKVMLGVVALANTVSLFTLVHELLNGSTAGGHPLIQSSVVIWLTNVGIFALAFWELDRGGPDDRAETPSGPPPSFLFPQMTLPNADKANWQPSFVDYLYVSFTNATAFSPTDTMPLGPWPKMLMLVQSLASLVTVGLVAARAVNILK